MEPSVSDSFELTLHIQGPLEAAEKLFTEICELVFDEDHEGLDADVSLGPTGYDLTRPEDDV